MRKKIIAGNWKMNMTPKEAVTFVDSIKNIIDTNDVDVVFCVPSIDIVPVGVALNGTKIALGAQNMYFEDSGAFTGEISPKMLKASDVKYVIIGHSERRAFFFEDNVIVNKKALKAISYGLIPIICVGESLKERENGVTLKLIDEQVREAFKDIPKDKASEVIIAYEPIWAIGTGKTATAKEADEVCGAIRKIIALLYDKETAEKIRIQYGGSVNAKNAAELFSMGNIDGGLVGGASLKMEFKDIVNYKK